MLKMNEAPVERVLEKLSAQQQNTLDYLDRVGLARRGYGVDGRTVVELIRFGLVERLPRGVGQRGGKGGVWYQLTSRGIDAVNIMLHGRDLQSDIAEDR